MYNIIINSYLWRPRTVVADGDDVCVSPLGGVHPLHSVTGRVGNNLLFLFRPPSAPAPPVRPTLATRHFNSIRYPTAVAPCDAESFRLFPEINARALVVRHRCRFINIITTINCGDVVAGGHGIVVNAKRVNVSTKVPTIWLFNARLFVTDRVRISFG